MLEVVGGETMSLVQALRERLQRKPIISVEHKGDIVEIKEHPKKENFLVRGIRGQVEQYHKERDTYNQAYGKALILEIQKKAKYEARASIGSPLGAIGVPRVRPYEKYDPFKQIKKKRI